MKKKKSNLLIDILVKKDAAMEKYFVEIVNKTTLEVVSRMGPMAERKADKVEAGASINLNHREYFTRIVKED